jgi:hypothetical protein
MQLPGISRRMVPTGRRVSRACTPACCGRPNRTHSCWKHRAMRQGAPLADSVGASRSRDALARMSAIEWSTSHERGRPLQRYARHCFARHEWARFQARQDGRTDLERGPPGTAASDAGKLHQTCREVASPGEVEFRAARPRPFSGMTPAPPAGYNSATTATTGRLVQRPDGGPGSAREGDGGTCRCTAH